MLVDLFASLPRNIYNNFFYLRSDYIELSFDFVYFSEIIKSFFIAVFLILLSYLVGRKILFYFFKKIKNDSFHFLISIALGYITISTGIAIMGLFSLLAPPLLFSYILFLIIISFFPLSFLKTSLSDLKKCLSLSIQQLKINRMVFVWTVLFVFLAFIELINPEIREDQYHVDLPKMYLDSQTIMIPPKELIHVSGSSLLSEMYYLIGIFISSTKEVGRSIHFLFYLLVLITLVNFSKIKNYKFGVYAPLLFASAPVVIAETSSAYVDFQWMLCFLIFLLITSSINKFHYQHVIVSGLLLGGMLATKLWTIAFIPVSILYLLLLLKRERLKTKKILKFIVLFVGSIAIVSGIWFLRAYILTNNPLYPAFLNEVRLDNYAENYSLSHYLRINYPLFNPFLYVNVFSPLFFLGLLFIVYKFKENLKLLFKLNLFKYFILLFLVYALINYPYGRYLLGLYVLFIFISSLGLYNVSSKFIYSKFILNFLLFVFFSYYLINAILILPYSLGFAEKNKYLSRVLIRDNSSYYDFGGKFDKFIVKNDLVATYGLSGYYYANFNYVDVNYVFDKNNRSFDLLKKRGITKLFVKGGDMKLFCSKLQLVNCDESKYSLISSYLVHPTFYLYNLK